MENIRDYGDLNQKKVLLRLYRLFLMQYTDICGLKIKNGLFFKIEIIFDEALKKANIARAVMLEKMNDELSELQKNYTDLTRKYKELEQKNTQMPKIRVKSRDELRVYGRKVYYSVDTFTQIIRDFLNCLRSSF